ncbi:hypothetical protein HJC23_012856 [Cyclotella cryptica]|uniref:Ricin B lectin domain-containing protein n=1 Tax=Cyclotella cryptica TaxID=29204 RepID=A0ABD3Q2K3_9STRA
MERTNMPIDLDAMSSIHSDRRRLQMTKVVGGSLVVTFAALVSLSILAGVELHSKSVTKSAAVVQEDVPSTEVEGEGIPISSRGAPVTFVLPLPATSAPSFRPSSSPSESLRPSSWPSANPTASNSPSEAPSSIPSQSFEPTQTLVPTRSTVPSRSIKPSSSASPSQYPSVPPTTKPTHPEKFRLRLFWKPGYYWQESYEESWFCLACASCENNVFNASCKLEETCEEGMMLGLTLCEPGDNAKIGKVKAEEFTIWEKRNLFRKAGEVDEEGDVIQLFGHDLCIARESKTDVHLEKCTGDKEQRWMGFRPDREFELQPVEKKKRDVDRCLTQHHHPKRGERVYAEKCDTARKTTTSLWITY